MVRKYFLVRRTFRRELQKVKEMKLSWVTGGNRERVKESKINDMFPLTLIQSYPLKEKKSRILIFPSFPILKITRFTMISSFVIRFSNWWHLTSSLTSRCETIPNSTIVCNTQKSELTSTTFPFQMHTIPGQEFIDKVQSFLLTYSWVFTHRELNLQNLFSLLFTFLFWLNFS